jgi:potassium-transporting ATPase KdpC subunit
MKDPADKNRFHISSLATELRVSFIATISLTVILCGIYPLIVWALAQGLFAQKANGSLVGWDGKVVGSALIAQRFSGPAYFHPRPSAAGEGFDGTSSGGSNLGPTSEKLIDAVRKRIAGYRQGNGLADGVPIPADAVTTSGSGLDPHISVGNALLQARRIAVARGVSEKTMIRKIEAHTEGRDWGVFGEPRVNVLLINLELDGKL